MSPSLTRGCSLWGILVHSVWTFSHIFLFPDSLLAPPPKWLGLGGSGGRYSPCWPSTESMISWSVCWGDHILSLNDRHHPAEVNHSSHCSLSQCDVLRNLCQLQLGPAPPLYWSSHTSTTILHLTQPRSAGYSLFSEGFVTNRATAPLLMLEPVICSISSLNVKFSHISLSSICAYNTWNIWCDDEYYQVPSQESNTEQRNMRYLIVRKL